MQGSGFKPRPSEFWLEALIKWVTQTIARWRMQKDKNTNCFQVHRHTQTAPDECEDSHTGNEQEGSCISDSMPGLCYTLERLAGHYRKKENRAQTRSKDWRPEEWSGGACMGWKTQGGLEGAKILESEPHYLKRRVVEAIWMKKTSWNWNLNCALVRLGSQTLNEHMTFPSLIFVNSSFPPINHLNSAIINSCLYQPISVLYCAPSPHLANEGLRTKMSCTAVANFHAMLGYKRSLNHCSQHNNEPLWQRSQKSFPNENKCM